MTGNTTGCTITQMVHVLVGSLHIWEGSDKVYLLDGQFDGYRKINPPDFSVVNQQQEVSINWISQDGRGTRTEVIVETGGSSVTLNLETAKAWYKMIWDAIKAAESGEEANRDYILSYLTNYCGFLCLHFCRLFVKDNIGTDTLIAKNFITKFTNHWGFDYERINKANPTPTIVIPPHHSVYAKISATTANKGHADAKNLLSMLIYMTEFSDATKSDKCKAIMKSSCMLALSQVGLGLIHWAIEASEQLGVSLSTLVNFSALFEYKTPVIQMCCRLVEFTESNSKSWYYARLIDAGCLFELSTSQNPGFSVMCATIVDIRTGMNGELLNIAQFKNHQSHRERTELVATAIIETIKSKMQAVGMTEPAREVARTMNELRATKKRRLNPRETTAITDIDMVDSVDGRAFVDRDTIISSLTQH